MKILITGGAGLVGSECCRLFSEKGWKVISVDNYMRGQIFGKEGETRGNIELLNDYSVEHHEIDIRNEKITSLIKKVDAIIHTAAQPSHPKSIEIPLEDFNINAFGTLHLLESLRKYNKKAPFVFCSTNKVYGDVPNYFSYKIIGKRYTPEDPTLQNGFDERLRVDQCTHTPFGVSKLAADFYTQEYARLYGLKTGVFRMGCITGGVAKAVEQHNWEPYFIKKALTGDKLTIFGHKGYQVRDVIHAKDLAELFSLFVERPFPGEIFNVGGGCENSISLLEAIDLIEKISGNTINYEYGIEREGDHKWYISNLNKVKSAYKWCIKISLSEIFKEIHETLAPIYSKTPR